MSIAAENTTVKLNKIKGIRVSDAGGQVQIDLQTMGVTAISEKIEPDKAAVIGYALIRAAQNAENARAVL